MDDKKTNNNDVVILKTIGAKQAQEELGKKQSEYINDLKTLLANPNKLDVKVLQAKAQELFSAYKGEIANYKQKKIQAIEERLHLEELAKLDDLYNDLTKIA